MLVNDLPYASLWKRGLASFIDILIFGSLVYLAYSVFLWVIFWNNPNSYIPKYLSYNEYYAIESAREKINHEFYVYFYLIVFALDLLFFTWLPFCFDGRTLGKLCCGLQLYTDELSQVSYLRLIKRRYLPISIFILALVFILLGISLILSSIAVPVLSFLSFMIGIPLLLGGLGMWGSIIVISFIVIPEDDHQNRSLADILGKTIVLEHGSVSGKAICSALLCLLFVYFSGIAVKSFNYNLSVIRGRSIFRAKSNLDYKLNVRPDDTLDPRTGFNEYERAMLYLKLASEIDRKKAFPYYWIGIIESVISDEDDSIIAFDEAIKRDPTFTAAYYSRAVSKAVLGKHEEALRDYNKTESMGVRLAEMYFNRSLTRGELKDYKGKLADLNEALKIDPKYAPAIAEKKRFLEQHPLQ